MEPLLKPKACQEYLGVGRTVLYELMRRKDDPLPFLNIAGRRRFDPAAVRAWVSRREGSDNGDATKRVPKIETPVVDELLRRDAARLQRRRAASVSSGPKSS